MTVTLKARIRHWRKVAGLSQSSLAREVGVSPGAVWQWESGDAVPTIENLEKLAQACGVELRIFFGSVTEAAAE